MRRRSENKTIVMIAGEASGDLHGANVIRALQRRHPGIIVYGAGGSAMQAAGAKIMVHAHQLSVMGFTALFSKIPTILGAASELKRLLRQLRPDLLILIDFPDFNLHMAGYAKSIGIPVLYYISPQIWAWRANRIRKIKRRVDHMAVILPFEKQLYEKNGIPVSFVGHPLMDAAIPSAACMRVKNSDPRRATISLLPGSRTGEVNRLLPAMLRAAERLQHTYPGMGFLLSCAPTIERGFLQRIRAPFDSLNLEITDAPVAELFARSQLTIVASGTASLEAAIFGIPAILIYSTSALNYLMAKLLINVPYIGLANLIAQKRVMPELIQHRASPARIASAAENLLSDPEAHAAMQRGLSEIRKRLGDSGASDRVAEIACKLMQTR